MIKINNAKTYGWETAFNTLRSLFNSTEKSDTLYGEVIPEYIGKTDLELLHKTEYTNQQNKYTQAIIVSFDLIAPIYWCNEISTNNLITCSSGTLKDALLKNTFTLEDFSCDLISPSVTFTIKTIIDELNHLREIYLFYETAEEDYWERTYKNKENILNSIVQLLPTSYNQHMVCRCSYEALALIYKQYKDNLSSEWKAFCEWIKGLPYSDVFLCN